MSLCEMFPEDLARVAKCPRRAFLFKEKEPHISKERTVFFQCIKKGYLHLNERRVHAEWVLILRHADKLWYKDADVIDDITFIREKKRLEPVLKSLHYWYMTVYKQTHTPGYVGIKLEREIGGDVLVTYPELAILEDHPVIVDTVLENQPANKLRLDYRVRTIMWLFAKCAKVDSVGWRSFTLKECGGLAVNNYQMSSKQLNRMDNVINQLVHILRNNINYPTFINCEECESTGRCVI